MQCNYVKGTWTQSGQLLYVILLSALRSAGDIIRFLKVYILSGVAKDGPERACAQSSIICAQSSIICAQSGTCAQPSRKVK